MDRFFPFQDDAYLLRLLACIVFELMLLCVWTALGVYCPVPVFIAQVVCIIRAQILFAAIRRAATIDPATGLLNRVAFDGAARQTLTMRCALVFPVPSSPSTRTIPRPALVILPIKSVIKAALRGVHCVIGHDGRHFLILLPRQEGDAAVAVAAGMRQCLEAHPLPISASIGVSTSPMSAATLDALVAGAVQSQDAAMPRWSGFGTA